MEEIMKQDEINDTCQSCCGEIETKMYNGVDLCEDCACKLGVVDSLGLGCDGSRIGERP